jgi:hypothetical protein
MKQLMAVLGLVVILAGMTSGIALASDQSSQDTLASPENGGGLMSDNGQLDWSLPPGAYPVNVKMLYLPNSALNYPAPPDSTIWIGQPFTLQMFDYDTMALISSNKPATLTMHYQPDDLGGRGESTLRVICLNGTQWFNLPGTVDTAKHVVIVQTPYSGSYGLVADNVSAAAAPAAAPAPATAPAPAPAPAPAAPTVPMSSSISGRVFYDKNGNGVMDGDDFPISGAGLLITSGSWSAFTRTGSDGSYAFGVLRESSYAVQLVVGPEWAFTTPNIVEGIRVTGQSDSRGDAAFGMWYRLPQ